MKLLSCFVLGIAFGYLYFHWMRSTGHSLHNMLLRLFVYATTLYLLITRFGVPAGGALLAGVLVSRVLVRSIAPR